MRWSPSTPIPVDTRLHASRNTIKEPSPRYFRVSVELDHATALAFSDNSKRLVCATEKSKVRRLTSVARPPTLPQVAHAGVGYAPLGMS